MPRNEDAAKALKKRTLTKLCNTRLQWLADAHAALDAAVAAAYGTHCKEQLLCPIQPDCWSLHRAPCCDSRWMSLVSILAHSKP